jgi:hypothetical protein
MIKYTPENITELKPNEIFVFGANTSGFHAGGAAKVAHEKFGAVWGVGYGHTGQCFAIPTLKVGASSGSLEKVFLGDIAAMIDGFMIYAKYNPDLTFYFTKIGLGIAGYELEDIARIVTTDYNWVVDEYIPSIIPSNVILPKEFVDFAEKFKK